MLTLSVSISASESPRATGSPTFLRQARILPSSIVSPILGMTTVCMAFSLRLSYRAPAATVRAGTIAFTAAITSACVGSAAFSNGLA